MLYPEYCSLKKKKKNRILHQSIVPCERLVWMGVGDRKKIRGFVDIFEKKGNSPFLQEGKIPIGWKVTCVIALIMAEYGSVQVRTAA